MPQATQAASKRVLVIDDDQGVRESLTMLFEHYGWEVLAVESGDIVLESLRPIDYQLAVVDHLMEGADGVEVIRELKNISTAPVFMLTGCVDPAIREAAELVGADRYFSKPIQASEMIEALKEISR
ncbi:response regulator [Pelagicoccus sp. SDUM812003]|uniref:response regulator n=1 Tax=Pelagicoccus sp. SDUM812003 TaxID=3041267 RepID=UPI00280DF6FE|nr:response regulator [Pelagicoccus sp. SDUM812003]MDQ8203582.1 response regulator [Pelagicoccus sp. SDUM812003]